MISDVDGFSVVGDCEHLLCAGCSRPCRPPSPLWHFGSPPDPKALASWWLVSGVTLSNCLKHHFCSQNENHLSLKLFA